MDTTKDVAHLALVKVQLHLSETQKQQKTCNVKVIEVGFSSYSVVVIHTLM